MKRIFVFISCLILMISAKGQENSENKSTVMARSNIILYVIDTSWSEFRGCYCYTSLITEGTKVEVDPGIHTFEFKYPKIGWSGKIYSAKFYTESGKKYVISRSDTNESCPMITIDDVKLKYAVIKQISIPKPESKELKTMRLPDVDSNNCATIVSNCCDGLYDMKGKPLELGSVIRIFKIDSVWGPYSIGFDTGFNRTWDGKFTIEVPAGNHIVYLAVYPPSNINTVLISTNLADNRHRFVTPIISKNVFRIPVNFEAGKKYGFDYKLCFKNAKISGDSYYEIKIVEVPGQ